MKFLTIVALFMVLVLSDTRGCRHSQKNKRERKTRNDKINDTLQENDVLIKQIYMEWKKNESVATETTVFQLKSSELTDMLSQKCTASMNYTGIPFLEQMCYLYFQSLQLKHSW